MLRLMIFCSIIFTLCFESCKIHYKLKDNVELSTSVKIVYINSPDTFIITQNDKIMAIVELIKDAKEVYAKFIIKEKITITMLNGQILKIGKSHEYLIIDQRTYVLKKKAAKKLLKLLEGV